MASHLDSLTAAKREAVRRLAGSATPRAATADRGAASARVSASSHLAPADVARLRLRVQSLTDENECLRRNLKSLTAQARRSEAELQALRCTAQQREARATERHATAAAQLEEQARRQQRALLNLAHNARAVAWENAELQGRLAALQDEQDDSRCSQAALQERLAQLQAVCLELDSQAAAGVGGGASADAGLVAPLLTGGGGQVQLLEQLLGTLRVLGPASGSSPPPVASSKEQAAAKGLRIDLRLALREQEGLRRERDGLAAKLRAAEAQAAKLRAALEDRQQILARERHAAGSATVELRRQLKAAKDRVEGMTKRCREKDEALAERDAYVTALEQGLLKRRQLSGGGNASSAGAGGAAAAAQRVRGGAAQHSAVAASSGPCGLAALSDAGSPALPWRRQQQEQEQHEFSLASLQAVAAGAAAGPQSPGGDSPLGAKCPRRWLHWEGLPQAEGEEEEWVAYQLGSLSSAPMRPMPLQQARLQQDGMPAACSNPLFSFHAQPAAARISGAAGASQLQGAPRPYSNELFCGAAVEPPCTVAPGGGDPAPLPLPPYMPSGEFESVSALLEALTPGSQQAAAAGAAGAGAGAQLATPAAQLCVRPGSATATANAVERKLQHAVASFFAESVQKKPAPPPAECRTAALPGSNSRLATLFSASKRHQQQQLQVRQSSGKCAAVQAPGVPMRNGRPNRAADQQGQQRGGAAQGLQWSPGQQRMCYA